MNFMGYNIDSPDELRQKILDFLGVIPTSSSPTTGGVLPMVTGSIPPELVYLPDGSLVYFEI